MLLCIHTLAANCFCTTGLAVCFIADRGLVRLVGSDADAGLYLLLL